ncbi:MAG: hypothetical protein GKR92_11310 [Gammaproteobacteria bacterium]|nr:MAG: hypothetical protein GKR92_11310 [Gammaproteobacteria bacterium]
MIDCKCCFAITLIKEEFACEQAQLVTRRAGPDTACASEQGSQRCQQLYDQLKLVGLPAFDAEDDLLKTPASVFSKIQFGGLLGLAKIVAEDVSKESNRQPMIERVENIYQLLEQAVSRYESVSNIPYPELVDSMTAFKIKRKR